MYVGQMFAYCNVEFSLQFHFVGKLLFINGSSIDDIYSFLRTIFDSSATKIIVALMVDRLTHLSKKYKSPRLFSNMP